VAFRFGNKLLQSGEFAVFVDHTPAIYYINYMKRILLFTCILFISVSFSNLFGADSSLHYLNRMLSANNQSTQKSMNRLSSGVRLITDDPAGKAIYEALEKHIRGLDQSIENSYDMISYYNTKEGALDVSIDSLQRIRQLSLKLANGFWGGLEKEIIKDEINHLYDHILDTLKRSEFNTKPLFAELLEKEKIQDWFKNERYYQVKKIDRMLKYFVREQAIIGARTNKIKHRINQKETEQYNTEASQAQQGDINYSREISKLKQHHTEFLVNLFLLKTKAQK